MAIIGGILAVVGGIAWLVLWILSLIKIFKAGDTLWGVLTIFFSPIVPIIWGFMNNNKKLAIQWIIVAVVFFIGYGITAAGMVSQLQNMQVPQ